MNVEHRVIGPRPLTKEAGVGVVVIGRNEGQRLKRCLESIISQDVRIVYVDSGSSDDSVETALRSGAEVVELDMSIPFCAARARNAGYKRLVESHPRLIYVQFVDGDCEMIGDWLPFAVETLLSLPDHAVAAGWLREKFPEISIYNRLGDLEWNFVRTGAVDAVGGIFMIRREAFDSVGGFDSTIAAGEEPELCQRLVRKGWRLVKLDRDMALHDLAMTRFGQWWRRMVRSGYGSVDVAHRFGVAKFAHNNLRVRIWSLWLTLLLAAVGIALGSGQDSQGAQLVVLLIFALWPAQIFRIALRTWRKGQPAQIAAAYAYFMTIAFVPQILGQILYFADRLRNRSFRLVEYKTTPPSNGENRR
jgi:glycosyltransferase involved in cell wall biosynthesis